MTRGRQGLLVLIALVWALVLALPQSARAEGSLSEPSLSEAQCAIVEDSEGNVLYSKNADKQMPMASITKVMTAVVALDSGVPFDTQVEGFKPETHTISMDGILVNKSNKLGDTDKTYRTLQILGNEASIDLDVKQAENEVRNRAEIVGNIADINLHEDKKFAVVTLMHHYRPEGSEKEYETVVDVRINGDRKFSKEAYEAIVKGELGKGDFVRLGGQLHNNRFENEEGVRYGVSMDLTSYALLKKSQKQAEKAGEKVEVKEEKKAAKAASKKAAPKKEAAPKKATPRKKGVRMG